jgi:hypothetical protein
MAKVKIQGNASGTGVLTVTAPNTSTDRTITLPDSTGTLATTADSVGGATGVDFNDNTKARFGTGNDLEIYHDGSNSIIHDNGTGDLLLRGDNVKVMNAAGTENKINIVSDGLVRLFYDNVTKFETTATGVAVTGGVAIGGTGADNTLEDYEEGTWTPTITRNSSAPSVTYTNQVGTYTKIGNMVIIYGDINWSANTGGSGNARVALPFTSMGTKYFKPESRSYTGLSVGVDYTPAGYTNGANLEIQSINQSSGQEAGTNWAASGRYNFQITILV